MVSSNSSINPIMNSPTATQQIRELISQIEQRDSLNCAQAFLAITERLRILYELKIRDYIPTAKSMVQTKIVERKKTIEELLKQLQDLERLNKNLEQEIDAEKELEGQKQQIEAAHAQLKQRLEKIKELRVIKEELERPENDFDTLDKEKEDILIGYEEVVKRQTKTLNRVNELLQQSTSVMDSELRTLTGTVKDNIQNLQYKNTELLKELSTEPLRSGAESLDKKLDEVIAEYNKYIVKIQKIKEELDIINMRQEAMAQSYKERYDVDKEIFGELEEPVAINQYIEESMKEMDDLLAAFEKRICELVSLSSQMSIPEIYIRQSSKINGKIS